MSSQTRRFFASKKNDSHKYQDFSSLSRLECVKNGTELGQIQLAVAVLVQDLEQIRDIILTIATAQSRINSEQDTASLFNSYVPTVVLVNQAENLLDRNATTSCGAAGRARGHVDHCTGGEPGAAAVHTSLGRSRAYHCTGGKPGAVQANAASL